MKYLLVMLLSASLLLTGGEPKLSDADLETGSRLIALFQTFFERTETVNETATTTERVSLRSEANIFSKSVAQLPSGTQVEVLRSETVLNTQWYCVSYNGQEGWVKASSLHFSKVDGSLPANVAVVTNTAKVYSSYNPSTRVMAQLDKGATLTVLRRVRLQSNDWVYATVQGSGVSGWVLESELNMPTVCTNQDLDPAGDTQTYVPTYAQIGYVISRDLNIRTAPGTNFDRIGAYSGGERIGILETNSGWGRTVDGWVYMGYVYYEGQVGTNCLIGNVVTAQLNIRSGPSVEYPATGSYSLGERVMVLEQVYSGNQYWGYTRKGWICMSYVQPDYIPGTTTPITGYGIVTTDSVDVLDSTGAGANVVSKVTKGTVLAVLKTAKVGDNVWGRTPDGWVNMNALDMRAIFNQTYIPSAPTTVTPDPTEPPTEAPTEEPTEPPTEPPTEETTEATTEPSTEAPTTAPSEAPTQAPGETSGETESA